MATAAKDGFDEIAARTWLGYVRAVLWPYFRPQVIGAENIPRGRGIIVGLHSGVIPYDAACALVAIHDATGRFARSVGDRFFRGLGGRVESFLSRQGAFIGEPANAERLLRRGNLILNFPGGARDMERSYFTRPYRVCENRGWAAGHGGFVKLALRTSSPIIPMAVVGTEEVHVMITNAPRLARLLRVPLFPLVLSPLPLPAKFYIRFGRPIHLGGDAADARDQRKVDGWTAQVRRDLQSLIDDTLGHRLGVIVSSYRDASLALGGPRSARPQRRGAAPSTAHRRRATGPRFAPRRVEAIGGRR